MDSSKCKEQVSRLFKAFNQRHTPESVAFWVAELSKQSYEDSDITQAVEKYLFTPHNRAPSFGEFNSTCHAKKCDRIEREHQRHKTTSGQSPAEILSGGSGSRSEFVRELVENTRVYTTGGKDHAEWLYEQVRIHQKHGKEIQTHALSDKAKKVVRAMEG